MEYKVVEVGGDPEFDEPGFTVVKPRGASTYIFEEVMWDYQPAEPDPLLEEALLSILPSFAKYARKFGLKAPIIALADLSGGHNLAQLVEGTESQSPVFLVDPVPTKRLHDPTEFVYHTLAHELGHAYLRTLGVEYEEEEEDVVEEFALTGKRSLLDEYAEVMA